MEGWWEDLTEDCRLMNFESWQAKVSISRATSFSLVTFLDISFTGYIRIVGENNS